MFAGQLNKFKKEIHPVGLVIFFSLSTLVSCVQSSSPNVSEIIETLQPTINGQSDISFTSSSSIFNIAGACDTKSFGTEYTINGGTSWTDLGLCTTGAFNFNVVVYTNARVEIRSRTKFSYTKSAVASIRVVIPPTANLLTFVTASNSALSSLTSPTLSFTMSSYMTGQREPPILNTYNMDTLTTGIVYAP